MPDIVDPKETTICRWQNQAAQGAALLKMQQHSWSGNDSGVWALLECLARDRTLNEVLYDLGYPQYGPPEPDWETMRAVEELRKVVSDE